MLRNYTSILQTKIYNHQNGQKKAELLAITTNELEQKSMKRAGKTSKKTP